MLLIKSSEYITMHKKYQYSKQFWKMVDDLQYLSTEDIEDIIKKYYYFYPEDVVIQILKYIDSYPQTN